LTETNNQKRQWPIILLIAVLIIALAFAISSCGKPKIAGDWYGDNMRADHLIINKNGRFSSEYMGIGTYHVKGKNITFSNGFEQLEAVIIKQDGKTVIFCPELAVKYYRSRADIPKK